MEELPGIKEIAGKEGLGFGWGGVAMSRHESPIVATCFFCFAALNTILLATLA
jgi:hypothetical protein